ncbi:MAG: hypothetical protein E6J34_13465 [Chloroflexi bacterium]|nr:MAG: hypothetical protein E6J34_13465 [Chloroflexota bacterium]
MQQTIMRPEPGLQPNNSNPRYQNIIITAISLCALSGLLIGFAVGALTRTKQATQPGQAPIAAIQGHTPTVVLTQVVNNIKLGCPIIDNYSNTAIPNGTISNTMQIHAVDATGKCAISGNPVQRPDITCKLWLSKIHVDQKIVVPDAMWRNTSAIAQPFSDEIQNGLVFDDTTPQTQMCNSRGQATWKFGISPAVNHGTYLLAILTDWGGTSANWSWAPLKVMKGD